MTEKLIDLITKLLIRLIWKKFKSMLKSNIKDIDEKKDADAFELQDRYDMNELYMYITIELNSRKNK